MTQKLKITIEVEDDISAYRVLNRIDLLANLLEAEYDGKKYQFSKEDATRLPKYFLRKDFGKRELLDKK